MGKIQQPGYETGFFLNKNVSQYPWHAVLYQMYKLCVLYTNCFVQQIFLHLKYATLIYK